MKKRIVQGVLLVLMGAAVVVGLSLNPLDDQPPQWNVDSCRAALFERYKEAWNHLHPLQPGPTPAACGGIDPATVAQMEAEIRTEYQHD